MLQDQINRQKERLLEALESKHLAMRQIEESDKIINEARAIIAGIKYAMEQQELSKQEKDVHNQPIQEKEA